MRARFIGGILLIVGTSIGGGMLALPVANAATGFWQSSAYLLLGWFFMTLGAFFILEVNLYLPPGKNMISMAATTLGTPGLITAWLSYILLLYSLLSAYISGGADVMGGLLNMSGISLPSWFLSILFTLLFGIIVYGGIRQVDLLNRVLMFVKLTVYFLLVVLIAPHIRPSNFQGGDYQQISSSIMILLTSYGFAIIVPNLREYFNDDLRTLRKLIFIGSLIPLVCYLAWDAVIMGAISRTGDQSLMSLISSPHTTSTLAMILTKTVNNSLISSCFNLFTSICMLTAFLGVSLCLISFLADGLGMSQYGTQGFIIFLLTFFPPLLIVIYYPGAYLHALSYAGYFCVILLLLLPALMSYYGRKQYATTFIVPGGRWSQWAGIIASIVFLLISW